MKIQFIFIQAYLLLAAALPLSAQQVSKDSIEALKNQKQSIQASAKLNERKMELAKLENELIEKTSEAQKENEQAQKSADENQALADKLKNDPQNKKLSNQAAKSARSAEKNAKSARKAADKAEGIKKDIESLKKEIAEEEAKIGSLGTGNLQSTNQQAASQPMPSNSQESVDNSSSPVRVTMPPISAGTAQSTDQSAAGMAQKVVESTYRSYPQQQGQPTIIINNIISPGYGQAVPAASKPETPDLADRKEFEDFKAWKRQNQMQSAGRLDERQSGLSNSNRYEGQPMPEKNQYNPDEKMSFRQRFGEKPPRNSGLWVIPMVGVHASNFKADLGEGKADGRTGWNAGLDFRIHAKRFFIQPGAHYFSSSMRITSEDSISNAPLLSGPRIHSLKVPLLLGLYLTKANKGFFKMNVKAGATGTYILAVDKNESRQFSKENIEEYSYGLNAGLGLEFGLITLDFSHEWGMSPLFKDNSIKNNVLRATVGLKL